MGWKESGTTFENAPVGTHIARCIKVIDIGTQSGDYQGKPTSTRKNVIYWELPFELREDGKPFIVSKFYTASLGEKANLRKDLVSWRGKEFTAAELRNFEEKNILDQVCQVTIIEKENGKTAITSVSGKPKGVEVPPRHNDLVLFLLEDFDQATYDKLSEGMKKLIRASAEYGSLGVIESSEATHTGGSSANLNSAADYAVQAAAAAHGQGNGIGGNSYSVPDEEIPF